MMGSWTNKLLVYVYIIEYVLWIDINTIYNIMDDTGVMDSTSAINSSVLSIFPAYKHWCYKPKHWVLCDNTQCYFPEFV